MKRIVVLGAGGFIGGHMVHTLKSKGHYVIGVDIKHHGYRRSVADEFIIADLRDPREVDRVIDNNIDEVYQFAADMGGAQFIFTGDNDADIMHNSAMINLNVCEVCSKKKVGKVFFSSSACIYPSFNQLDPNNPNCEESSAYPAMPDSEYGWEKLFSERMYLAYNRNKGLNVRIARFHNIYGPYGSWNDGREKAPAALCRKVINTDKEIEIWGDGKQTRSFLYIDDCIQGVLQLMESDFMGPVNIGSEEMVSINDLAKMIIQLEGRDIKIVNKDVKHLGVRGRNSHNKLVEEKIKWGPMYDLSYGIKMLFNWIKSIQPN